MGETFSKKLKRFCTSRRCAILPQATEFVYGLDHLSKTTHRRRTRDSASMMMTLCLNPIVYHLQIELKLLTISLL